MYENTYFYLKVLDNFRNFSMVSGAYLKITNLESIGYFLFLSNTILYNKA